MMRFKYKNTLILFTVGIFSILLTGILFYSSQKSREINNIKISQDLRMEDIICHIKKEIEHRIQIVDTLSQNQMIVDQLQKSNNEFNSFSKDELIIKFDQLNKELINASSDSHIVLGLISNPLALNYKKQQELLKDEIDGIFLTNKYGLIIASTKTLNTITHSHKSWWKDVENASIDETFVYDLGFSESGEGYVLGVIRPVLWGNKIKGVLNVNFKIETLLEEIVHKQKITNRETMVIRSGGMVIKEIPTPKKVRTLSENFLSEIISHQGQTYYDKDKNLFISSFKVDLDERFHYGDSSGSIYHNEINSGEYWFIVEQYDANTAMSSFYSDFKVILLFSFSLLIILSILVFILSDYMMQPIKRMINTLSEIESGDLFLRLDVHEPGELGSLSNSFNSMMDRLFLTTASKQELEVEIMRRKNEEERYSQLFNSMAEGFATHEIIMDGDGKAVNYKFKSVNPAYEKLLGVKASDIIDKTVLDVFPDTESYWIDRFAEVALTGKTIHFENYFKSLNCYYSVSAFCVGRGEFAVSFSDITARVTAEKELEEKNEILSTTLKSIGDGVITTDKKGNITFLNTIAEELTGWNHDDSYGRPLDSVFQINCDQSNEQCENQAIQVLKSGQIIEFVDNITLISRNGEIYRIEDCAAPIYTQDGQILGVIIVFRNVTEKLELRDSINKNQRLESLGILASGIAHDFNNYLTGINGYVELVKIRLEKEDSEKNISYLNKVLNISELAKLLTNQLMTFSKGGNTSREIVDLKDVINNSINSLLSGSKIIPYLLIEKDLWECDCDKNRIIQCIDNLVLNSMQSMPNGGSLIVSARNLVKAPSQFKDGNYIEVRISDTGSGIPFDIRDKIFDPFFSSKAEGNGLGLTTVFSIIKKHDGYIHMESDVDEGTTFTFYLPAFIKSSLERSNNKVE